MKIGWGLISFEGTKDNGVLDSVRLWCIHNLVVCFNTPASFVGTKLNPDRRSGCGIQRQLVRSVDKQKINLKGNLIVSSSNPNNQNYTIIMISQYPFLIVHLYQTFLNYNNSPTHQSAIIQQLILCNVYKCIILYASLPLYKRPPNLLRCYSTTQ